MRDNQLIKVDPTRSTYLACALLMRGNGCTISDLHQNVARIKHRLTMVSLPHVTKALEGLFSVGLNLNLSHVWDKHTKMVFTKTSLL
jgi:hypothetical protein